MAGAGGRTLGLVVVVVVVVLVAAAGAGLSRRREDKTRCPQVKAVRDLDLQQLLGRWFVVQYYASSEEELSYRCMRAELSLSPLRLEVSMNFTYSYTDDPDHELLFGNITWQIPESSRAAHWVHAEDPYEGVYNTYVVSADYKSWALLLHCAEKSKSPRYLSSFIMSRLPSLPKNVISYLREKLPRYDIDLAYMFPMQQDNCPESAGVKKPFGIQNIVRGHPLKNY